MLDEFPDPFADGMERAFASAGMEVVTFSEELAVTEATPSRSVVVDVEETGCSPSDLVCMQDVLQRQIWASAVELKDGGPGPSFIAFDVVDEYESGVRVCGGTIGAVESLGSMSDEIEERLPEDRQWLWRMNINC